MTLEALNGLDEASLGDALRNCCGSTRWVEKMRAIFPVADREFLYAEAVSAWRACSEEDWREAFGHHPRIGDLEGLKKKFAATADWASQEQAGTGGASMEVLEALAEGNEAYERRYGYIFIVCATGKTAEEMLGLLRGRIGNVPEAELLVAMGEQEKITRIRLEKLLS
ncbi:MAG: 2-oxo-4-hydroxy-4-carboxy-5-ureidoimidazoline decarboxylase [Bacteroidetes bacterium]|nr:2-oxo-4-hydroxy-4-carboxy-5-ureidoimidazoline decarboxylase [Bacteroidota bacterium]